MKNLTSKILTALIVSVVGVTSADAATKIAAKSYVDDKVAPKADKVVPAVAGNLAGLNASGNLTDSGIAAADIATTDGLNALTTRVTTAEGNITTLGTTKADATTVTALDTRVTTAEGKVTTLEDFKDRAAGFATAAQGALADTALQSAALNDYAKTADVYTKTAADSAFAEKALETTVSDFQGRAAGFATAAQGALADTALQSAALNDYAKSAAVTTEIGTAITGEKNRADAAYAEKALETTVSNFQGRAAGFATAAQGALADTALQSAALEGLAAETYVDTAVAAEATARGTAISGAISAEVTRANAAYATAAQGAKADTALQAADIANKADKATTLAGYGITDGATKTELGTKADKAIPETAGNIATLDATGNLVDGGALGMLAQAAPGECADETNSCVLTYNGDTFAWEVIQR